MILIKMDKLTESELRNIAQTECIEDYMSLSRDEIIQALTEKYEEEDDNFAPDEESSPNLRYLSGITDYRAISNSVEGLPGVEELPESYPETAIHLLTKNYNWAFCFWSISTLDKERMEENGATPALVVTINDKNGRVEQYDIPITYDDSEWNISLSVLGGVCTVSIVSIDKDGNRDTLAISNTISRTDSYWMQHTDQMKENDTLFKVYLSLITTKENDLIKNPLIEDIYNAYLEEDRDE